MMRMESSLVIRRRTVMHWIVFRKHEEMGILIGSPPEATGSPPLGHGIGGGIEGVGSLTGESDSPDTGGGGVRWRRGAAGLHRGATVGILITMVREEMEQFQVVGRIGHGVGQIAQTFRPEEFLEPEARQGESTPAPGAGLGFHPQFRHAELVDWGGGM